MYRINGIKVPLTADIDKAVIAKKLKINESDIQAFYILKKAVDARKKSDVHYVFSVAVETAKRLVGYDEYKKQNYVFEKGNPSEIRPVIVGMGPCGLFAGLMLANAGYQPIILERGADVDSRVNAVNKFWETGKLDPKTNVQFGEGGAGTFSDGKLNSGIHDMRCQFVLDTFVQYGADKQISYTAKPHIGTDVLSKIVKNMRMDIEKYGGEVRFMTKMTEIITDGNAVIGVKAEDENGEYIIDTDAVILAIGHSARDTYRMIKNIGAKMEQKNFSVGVRIEHNQKMINESQYGEFSKYLGAADYKLSTHFDDGRSAYTFCMCPGGVVVASSSAEGMVVTNGMSYSDRGGENANSALLINVTTDDFSSDDPLSGVDFQEEIEKKAFIVGGCNYNAPCEYVKDFLGTETTNKVNPTYKPGVKYCDISEVFPEFVTENLKKAIIEFDKKIKGFADGGAVITAPETRSSAPVRILRDKETLMSNISGIYPAGEGAGYAGGIMSAAVDGIKISEAYVRGRNIEHNIH